MINVLYEWYAKNNQYLNWQFLSFGFVKVEQEKIMPKFLLIFCIIFKLIVTLIVQSKLLVSNETLLSCFLFGSQIIAYQ